MRSPGIRSAPSQVLPAPRPKAMGFVVVLALHGVFIAALNAGLGRKLLESPAMVVFADMISAPSTPPVPPPPPKEVVTPKAAAAPTPAPIPTQPAPLAEPTPVTPAPSNAIAPPTPAPSTPPAPTQRSQRRWLLRRWPRLCVWPPICKPAVPAKNRNTPPCHADARNKAR